MINKLSRRLTSFYIRKNKIEELEREMYDYCFEIMLSTLINIILVVVIGILSGMYVETIVFIVTFMLMREVGGGHHAKTHWCCILSVSIIFTCIVILLLFLPTQLFFALGIVLFVIGIIISLLLSPIDCANKRLDKITKRKLKKKLIGFCLLWSLINTVLWSFAATHKVAFAISCTVFSVSMLSIIGWIQNKLLRQKSS